MSALIHGSSQEMQLALSGLGLVAEASRTAIPTVDLLERTRQLVCQYYGSGRACLHLEEADLYSEEIQLAALGGCAAHEQDPALSLPLLYQGETFATLYLIGGDVRALTEVEVGTLQMLGQTLHSALQRELYQQELVARESIITTLAHAIEAKDSYTRGHVERVRDYAERLGRDLGLEGEDLQALSWAAVLHDVGKIGIPEAILNKPSQLSPEELAVIREHPVIGKRILSHLKSRATDKILAGVLDHHERYDGKGYPNGKEGEGIALIARIISVVDMFDAMTSDRPYRGAVSLEDAIAHLRKASGIHLDPDLVERFIRLVELDGLPLSED